MAHKFTRGAKGAAPKLVYRKQIAAALHWLALFALGNQGGLSKTVYLEDRFRDGVVLVCDASLWGGRVLGKCVRVL